MSKPPVESAIADRVFRDEARYWCERFARSERLPIPRLEFEDLARLYSEQLERNRRLRSRGGESLWLGRFSLPDFGLFRRFHQLPCTLATLRRRCDLVEQLAGPDDPLLLLGDDDHLSVELARREFRKISVVDIDSGVLLAIRRRLDGRLGQVRLVKHDLRSPLPPMFREAFRVVSSDPPCDVSGLRAFAHAAGEALAPDPAARWLLHTDPHAYGESAWAEESARLLENGWEPERHVEEFNAYPIPMTSRLAIRAFLLAVGARSGCWTQFLGSDAVPKAFVSDCFVLRRTRGSPLS